MDKLVDKMLRILRKQVNQNNEEIRLNQEEINRLLSNTIHLEKQKDLNNKYLLNKELLDENADMINFQVILSEFWDKYGCLFENSDDLDDESDENDDGCKEHLKYFNQTISGKIKFDHDHPQFNNPDFFVKLLSYYEEKEDYEMCDKLLKMIKSH